MILDCWDSIVISFGKLFVIKRGIWERIKYRKLFFLPMRKDRWKGERKVENCSFNWKL